MNFSPTGEQEALRRHYEEFARARLNDGVAERVRKGSFERPLWALCGQEKVQGLCIPEAYGGRGLGALDMACALEGLAYGCEDAGLLFAAAAQLLACNVPIWSSGTEAQKQALLPRLCNGDLIIANGMTEAGGGSAAFQMQSRAVRTESGYRLSGLKTYCANGPVSDLCLVYVLTNPDKGFFGGVSAFVLTRSGHGYRVVDERDKLGLRTCQTGRVSLEGVVAGAEDLLGREGGGGVIFNRSMEWERIGMSALHLGTMARLLERAVDFARRRRPGGTPISNHQAVAHLLADAQVDLEACRLMVYRAAWELEQAGKNPAGASACKLFVSEHFKSLCLDLSQVYAGEGLDADSEIGRSLHEAIASTVYSGTSQIQRNIIAGWMGL